MADEAKNDTPVDQPPQDDETSDPAADTQNQQ